MLEKLLRRYPLSPNWEQPQSFTDILTLGNLHIGTVGLATMRSNGTIITASAAEIAKLPVDRAYFELLRRTVAVDAGMSTQPQYQTISLAGDDETTLPREAIFPKDCDPSKYMHSKTNGFAIACNFQEARQLATNELIEKDRVLRSWYGFFPPQAYPEQRALADWPAYETLKEYYEIKVFLFQSSNDPTDVQVAGVFCFPRTDSAPIAYGFGTADTAWQAIQHARTECLEKIALLWGEERDPTPEFSPTSAYHQELFLGEEGADRLSKWLFKWLPNSTGNLGAIPQYSVPLPGPSGPLFVDLTPNHLERKLYVLKAIDDTRLPLLFGDGYRKYFPEIPEELVFHPVV